MKSLSPNLMVYNVNDTVDYYETYFGFKLINSVPAAGNFDWAMMQAGEITIMFQSKQSLLQDLPEFKELNPGGTFSLFIIVDDINSLYEQVKDNVEIVTELAETFYGMNEFTMKDLNDYLLTFAEPIPVSE